MNVIFQRGTYLPDLDLWLDSRAKRPSGYISHAHEDHVAPHKQPILTHATLALLRHRLQKSEPCPLEYGEPYETTGYTLTLYPAGHCLGSAQALIQSKVTGERVLYTGDFKVQPNPTAEAVEPLACDTLIMEATFGRPAYQFPPQSEVLEEFFHILGDWVGQGRTPVVFAYRTGKAQELLHYMLSRGFEVALEESVYGVAQRYQEAGVEFPGPFRSFDGTARDGEVLLFPPGKRSRAELVDLASQGKILPV